MATRKIEIVLPVTFLQKLEEIERKTGVTKEDLLMRAAVKVIEEFSK